MIKKRLVLIILCILVFGIIPIFSGAYIFGLEEYIGDLIYEYIWDFDLYDFFEESIWAIATAYAFVILPVGLSVWNIVNCFINKVVSERLSSSLTIIMGFILYVLYLGARFDIAGDWYEQIYTIEYHKTISSNYLICIILVMVVGTAGFGVLLFSNAKKLPPLISAFAIGAVIMLNVFQIFYAIQIYKNTFIELPPKDLYDIWTPDLYLYLYHFNVLLISALAVKRHLTQQLKVLKEEGIENYKNTFIKNLYRFMSNIAGYSTIIFVALFFIIAVLEIIFVILGKGFDGPIKAFTDTADWTFSKQIPPPPLEYRGHYLCTVAAGGHKKIVKPLRLGTRRNATIVVNRQLCIANAFEEKIQEISPKFHKFIRGVYDNYGFPLSTLITTPLKADIVYILMKPLEWIFLIFLYMTDVNPEKRIGRQYTYRQ